MYGKPDPNANLFGEARPRNWKVAKTELQRALADTAHGDEPIHNWLRTFRVGFDNRATGIIVAAASHIYQNGSANVLRYEPQLYDGLLRGAAVLLDRCLRYRVEMGQYELSGISAGISYLTFLKLKPLQRNFLAQSNTADIARIEKVASQQASERYADVSGLDRLFEAYQLQAKQIELAGSAAEAALAEAKDNFLTRVLEKQFHIQIDAQLAQFTRLFESGSPSNFAERYLRLLSMLTEDLADAYCKIYSASKGVQQVLGMNQVSVAINAPIRVDVPAFATTAAVRTWIDHVVPAQAEHQRTPDILDALVLWTRAVMRTLDAAAQYESEFTISIPLSQPLAPAGQPVVPAADIAKAFGPGSPTGAVTFTLPNTALPVKATPTSVRVIGIGLSVEHSLDDSSPVQYITNFPHTPAVPVVAEGKTPADNPEPTAAQIQATEAFELPRVARLNATVTTPAQTMQGGASYSRPKVFLPNVRIQGGGGGDLEPLISYDPACHGLNPFGGWTIALDPNAVAFYQSDAAIPISWIGGLILHLRLRCTLL